MLNDMKDWFIATADQVVAEAETLSVMDWSGTTLVVAGVLTIIAVSVVVGLFTN